MCIPMLMVCAAGVASCTSGGGARSSVEATPLATFTPREIGTILTLSPLSPPPADPTNAVADDPAAAKLGRFLFFDQRLSRSGTVSCASCHIPSKQFADGEAVPEKFSRALRHTPALWNVAYNRWYFWDGRADSLWSQAVTPLENPNEHGTDRVKIAALIRQDPALLRAYRGVFGPMPDAVPTGDGALAGDRRGPADLVIANVGKALAAYERKIVSRRSPFDVFVEGVRERNAEKMAALSPGAARGLRLFVGRGNCLSCHHGPNFTDGEFHDTGVSRIAPPPQADAGRFGGVNMLLSSVFNSQGSYSDAGNAKAGLPTAFLVNTVESKGQFKTPTLRNVAVTGPYMHRGQLKSLDDVVRFYSTLEVPPPPSRVLSSRGHAHEGGAEHVLAPLNLSRDESQDLIAFLESLTDTRIDPELMSAPAQPD